MEITTCDADWLIEQWMRWSRQGEGRGGTIIGNLMGGPRMPSPVVNDDEALAIDAIMAQLLIRMPDTGLAVIVYYRVGRNYSAVSKVCRVDRKRAAVMVQSGVAWVDGKMDDVRELDRVRNGFSALRRPMVPESYTAAHRDAAIQSRLIAVLESI